VFDLGAVPKEKSVAAVERLDVVRRRLHRLTRWRSSLTRL
jgi:hypothetical protein